MDLKTICLHYVLPILAYGAITGLANLILSKKSQIELWAEEHPKAAALQKFLRAVGLDPFNLVSALSLWAKGKLPEAQQNGAKAVAKFKADSVRPLPLGEEDITPKPTSEKTNPDNWPGPSAGGVALLLICCFAWSQSGCGLLAAAAPYLAEAGVVIADAVNDIELVRDLIAKFPGLSPDTRAALEKKLQAAQLALQAAAAADNGVKDLTAEQLDESFAAFRTAWFALADALSEAGIVPGSKIGGAAGGEVALPQPLALRPVVVK